MAAAERDDLEGNPRLLDSDEDGLATIDVGAYERPRVGGVPGEVVNQRWTSLTTQTWDAEPSAVEYHVYRGLVDPLAMPHLGYAHFGSCRDDLDPDRTDLILTDAAAPPPGAGYFYLVTAESAGGSEGTLGFGAFVERSNFVPCP